MTELCLYDKKKNKRTSKNRIEMDLNDLEFFAHYKHGKEFLQIPSTIVGNKSIVEWFVSDDVSYWWFISPIIHPKFKFATRFIDRLDSVVTRHSIDTIVLYGCYDEISLIKNFCKVNKIKLKISSGYYSNLIKQFGKNIVKKSMYKKINKQKIKKRIDCLDKKELLKTEPNSTIITAPGIYRRNSYDYNTKKSKKEEFFIQPILNVLNENNFPTICFDLDYTFRGDTEALKERLSSKFNWQPIEILLQGPKENDAKKIISILNRQFRNFKKNNLNSVFIYKDVSLWEFLSPIFEEIFYEPNLPTYVNLIHKLEKFFRQIKPRLIVQVYETGPFAKAMEVVAKKLGIKTIGIQHGVIPSDNADYIINEIKSEKFPYGNVIPDITFVFGDYYKKLLTEKGSYPTEKVVTIGNPSYFDIEKIKKSFNRTDLLTKYNFPDKKIILLPLSFRFFYYKNNPDRILLDSLYKKFKTDDVIVLVRPHPGDYLNQQLLEKYYPSKNFKISNATLVEDLFLSDVVIVLPISSVSMEAVLFEKPLILANVIIKNSESNFDEVYNELIKSKVALLSTLEEIPKAIKSIKKGDLWKMSDSADREKFLYSFFNYGEKVDLRKYLCKN